MKRTFMSLFMVFVAAFWFTGCANQFTQVIAETDSAIKEAKKKGADKKCHFDFDAVRGMRAKADKLFWACKTAKAIKVAKAATAKAKALCPTHEHKHPPAKHEHPHSHVVDSDGDGLLDNVDKCPSEPEDKDGFKDEDGCPDPDNDNDGILDVADKCPNKPETKNGYQDEDGCPDETPKKITLEGVNFETNSAELKASASTKLDEAGDILNADKKLRVRIEGHTDSRGAAAHNQGLSERRAESVKTYLATHHGISPGRMTTGGYGEGAPIASNDSDVGRAKNRRVELIPIVDISR